MLGSFWNFSIAAGPACRDSPLLCGFLWGSLCGFCGGSFGFLLFFAPSFRGDEDGCPRGEDVGVDLVCRLVLKTSDSNGDAIVVAASGGLRRRSHAGGAHLSTGAQLGSFLRLFDQFSLDLRPELQGKEGDVPSVAFHDSVDDECMRCRTRHLEDDTSSEEFLKSIQDRVFVSLSHDSFPFFHFL